MEGQQNEIKLEEEKVEVKNFNKTKNLKKFLAFFVALFFASYLVFVSSAPQNFPLGDIASIKTGDSLKEIGESLHKNNIIKSEFIFRITVIVLGGERRIIAGDYLLDNKETSVHLAYRFVKGQFHLEAIRITIPEGWNTKEIAGYLSKKIIKFDKDLFLQLAQKDEGFLFPDTYFVSATASPEEIIGMMKGNFESKIKTVKELSSSVRSLKEIITMASILEKEALPQDREMVSGILWKRISIGMPLQVDSSFTYINGKGTFDLTLDDLKIDSPYNSYKYKGLPPGPIGNPGLNSILASLKPIKTNYLYFLTEKDGIIHYAKTFEEHKRNKEKYLR